MATRAKVLGRRKKSTGGAMRQVGIVATALAGVAALGAVAMTVRMYPDIRRYLKIRAM